MEEILATYSYTELGPAYIISCTNTAECTKAIVPATYNNRKVTVLGDNCFKNATNLHTVEFEAPDNIERFANSCFQNCSSLINITLPKLSYQHGLGSACFWGCTSIKEMAIPETQTRIPQYCFYNCVNLTKIKISTKVAYVELGAFAGCNNLKTLVIPDITTQIGVAVLPSGIEMLVLGKNINQILANNPSPKEIIILADNPPTFSSFYPSNKVEKVYCHSGLAAKYKAAPGWSSLTAEFIDDDIVLYAKLNTYYAKEYFQKKIDSDSLLSADLIDDSASTNKFVTAAEKLDWDGKQDALTFDSAPTENSTNPVTSGGLYTEFNTKQNASDNSLTTTNKTISGAINELDANKVNTTDIVNDVVSLDTNKPLSANMGKALQDEIDNLKAIGRYLSGWDATTGLPTTAAPTNPYTYHSGDYYIVTNVGVTNYRPTGSSYAGVASTTAETAEVQVNDYYRYDGTIWQLEINTQRVVSFANIAGQPTENSNLATALGTKQDVISSSNEVNADYINDTNSTNKFINTNQANSIYAANKQNGLTVTFVVTTDQEITVGNMSGVTTIDWGDGTVDDASSSAYVHTYAGPVSPATSATYTAHFMNIAGEEITVSAQVFQNNAYITEVNAGNQVVAIAGSAFESSTLSRITLSNNCRSLGNKVFKATNITSLEIPEGITTLSSTCQSCTSLVDVTLPSTLNEILNNVFDGCTSLKLVTMKNTNAVITIGSNFLRNATNCRVIVDKTLLAAYQADSTWTSWKNQVVSLLDTSDLPKVVVDNTSTSLSSVALANHTSYYYRQPLSAVSVTFPNDAEVGDIVQLNFECSDTITPNFGSNVTTLNTIFQAGRMYSIMAQKNINVWWLICTETTAVSQAK